MKNASLSALVICYLHLFITIPIHATEVSFRGLGDLVGGDSYSFPHAVSDDGLVVVGYSDSASGRQAFRWTLEDGMTGLGDLAGGDFLSEAYGVSADGSVIVGIGHSDNGQQAFRWESDMMSGLENLPGGSFDSYALGVNNDGSIVVGRSDTETYTHAVYWDCTGPSPVINDLSAGTVTGFSAAADVSSDGHIIAGSSDQDDENKTLSGIEVARWVDSELEYLGTFFKFPSILATYATGISADGSAVVGNGMSMDPEYLYTMCEAFYWSDTEGIIGLGSTFEEPGESFALDVSGDGSIVVGCAWQSSMSIGSPQYDQAFIWNEELGMRDLESVLEYDFALDLEGWGLGVATGISADGQTIVGMGYNPDGYEEAWIATIPEPATILLMGLGATLIGKKRL